MKGIYIVNQTIPDISMKRVLETGLCPDIGITGPVVNQQLRESSSAQGVLAGQALFYDQIAIPTMDFGILSALKKWLSLFNLRRALEDGSIQFIRFPKHVVYGGNGAGIIANLSFERGQSPTWEWWHTAKYGPIHDALDLQIRHGRENIPDWERKSLFDAVMAACVEFEVSDSLNQHISQESYKDIIHDRELKNEIGRFYGYRDLKLNQLPGLGANQIRFFNGNQFANLVVEPSDRIDLVLILAGLNLQVVMSSTLGNCDLSIFNGTARILKKKLERSGIRRSMSPAFSRLMQIPGIPDVPRAVAEGRVELSSVWRARQSPNAQQFRQWLSDVDTGNGRELAALYVDALRHEPLVSSWPVRTFRWAILVAAGHIAASAGLAGEMAVAAAGAVDTFFVDKWLSGYSPSLFLDELKRIRIQPQPLGRS